MLRILLMKTFYKFSPLRVPFNCYKHRPKYECQRFMFLISKIYQRLRQRKPRAWFIYKHGLRDKIVTLVLWQIKNFVFQLIISAVNIFRSFPNFGVRYINLYFRTPYLKFEMRRSFTIGTLLCRRKKCLGDLS